MADRDPFETIRDTENNLFALKDETEFCEAAEDVLHIFRGNVCDTERRGREMSPLEIVLEASGGFIPVWQRNSTLRWRFQERSLVRYRDPDAVKRAIRTLLHQAIAAWGPAVPVSFKEDPDVWDFEIAIRSQDQCSVAGCTLANAFFPDQGQHELVLYPKMFQQDAQEQLETMAHEIGHIFGLRHFFALQRDTLWPAEVYGEHNAVSIMNYGPNSRLTDTDRTDLTRFYEQVWSGVLKDVNRTPIRLVKPFSSNQV